MRTRYKERLLKLAEFLEKLPKKHFDLSIVTNICDSDDPNARISELKTIGKTCKSKLNCGAAACAMGWCPAVFPKIVAWDEYDSLIGLDNINRDGWARMETYFGINNDQSFWLFQTTLYPNTCNTTPKEVAKRIKEFVADNGKIPQGARSYA